MKGGSPPKKRHMRSLPPFDLHLKYAPTSGSDWKRSCGITFPLPPEGSPPKEPSPDICPWLGQAIIPHQIQEYSFHLPPNHFQVYGHSP